MVGSGLVTGSFAAIDTDSQPSQPTYRSGVVLAMISSASFATSGTFGKSLLDAGWSPGSAVAARISLAALVLSIPAFIQLQGQWHLLRRNAGLIAVYGTVAIGGCQRFYFNAVQTLSVGVALLLEYLGLVLVVGWLWLRHGQRPKRWTLIGIVLSVAGLALVLDITGGMRVDFTGVLWGLGAAVGLATFFVLSGHDDTGLPPLVMAAAGMWVGAVVLGAAGLSGVLPMSVATVDVDLAGTSLPWWVSVAGLSLVAAAIAYSTGIAATRALGSKLASFIGLSEVLFAMVFAWLLLDDTLLAVQIAGGVLIVAGVFAVRYDEPDAPHAEEPILVDHLISEP